MTHVFLLRHTHVDENLPVGEDVKLLGVYYSHLKAEEALNASSTQPGFEHQLAGFEIATYELDKREWTEGFTTVREE